MNKITKTLLPWHLCSSKNALPFNTLSLAVLLASGSVHASTLEEVVVTAQKHAQGVNDIGITVNAFTGDQLKDNGVTTAEDIAVFTPGLTVNETAATGVPLYTIRGVGFQDYSTSASSTVGLYLDEVAIPYTVMSRGVLFDVERVEVLKGPQGDLYGRNTTAGQINFVSKKPTEEFEAAIDVAYDDLNVLDVEGFVSGSLSDSVNGRFALKSVSSNEGWQKSLTRNDRLGEKDQLAWRALFDISINDSLSALVNVHYVDDQSDNRANTAYAGTDAGLPTDFAAPYLGLDQYLIPGGASFGQTPPWYSRGDNEAADWTNEYVSERTGQRWNLRPRRDNQLRGASIKLEWSLGDIELTSITAYDEFERQESNDWDGTAQLDSSNINDTELDVFSQELRLSGQSDDLLWIAGLYFSQDDMEEQYHFFMADSVFGNGSIPFGVAPFNAAPILELNTRYTQETESAAIFGHVEWNFNDDWRLTAGLRYTRETRDWAGCTFDAGDGSLANFLNTSFGTTLSPGSCGTIDDDPNSPNYIFSVIGTDRVNDALHVYEDRIETKKWMGKLGIDYAINDDLLWYATYSNGFKSGGFNGANSNATSQLQPYGEEELGAFETGLKATLLDNTMQLNLAAFWYDYSDKQEQDVAVTFVGNIAGLTNVPESRINGAELDMQWLPGEGWTVQLGVAYLDTLVEEWQAIDQQVSAWPTVVRRDASGLELAQSPEWTYNATLQYQWALQSGHQIELGMDYSYQDETSGGVAPEAATDDYELVNLRAALVSPNEKWRVMAWVRNAFDEYYFPAAYRGGNGPYVRSAGMPRSAGVRLSYRF